VVSRSGGARPDLSQKDGLPFRCGSSFSAQGHRRTQEGQPAGCPLTCSVWRLGGGGCVRATGALCAASTHAGTDVRPIARCLRYGKLAPINNDVIHAMKRPNAIHLGCMVNLSLDGPRHPHTVLRPLAQGGGVMSVPPTDCLIAVRGTRPEHCHGRYPTPTSASRGRFAERPTAFQTRPGKRQQINQ